MQRIFRLPGYYLYTLLCSAGTLISNIYLVHRMPQLIIAATSRPLTNRLHDFMWWETAHIRDGSYFPFLWSIVLYCLFSLSFLFYPLHHNQIEILSSLDLEGALYETVKQTCLRKIEVILIQIWIDDNKPLSFLFQWRSEIHISHSKKDFDFTRAS